jgi:subtilisin family serine protease
MAGAGSGHKSVVKRPVTSVGAYCPWRQVMTTPTVSRKVTGLSLASIAIAVAALAISLGAPGVAHAQYGAANIKPPTVNIRPVVPNFGAHIQPHYSAAQSAPPRITTLPSQPRKKARKIENRGPSRNTGNAVAASNAAPNARFVPDEVLIEVAGNPSQATVDALAARHGLVRVQSQSFPTLGTTMFRWRIPDGRSVTEVARAIVAAGGVVDARPNLIYSAQQSEAASNKSAAAEGDPAQYTLTKLRVPLAHELARGGKVLVAVIDSGIDVNHPELAGVIADSFDSLDSNEPPHAHGTAIAGAIAAHARLMGVAPNARILAVRAFGAASKGAEGTAFNILRSLEWSVEHQARVINMSFAGPRDPGLLRMLAAARKKGVVLIAATGNAGPKSPPLYPAADPNVIAVTATDQHDKLFAASNRGSYVSVAAPGVDILLPAPNNAYQVTSGTSFAAAHVSGVAALIIERDPDLPPDLVRRILLTSARDLGPKGRDDLFGAGLVDAFRAVTQTAEIEARTARRSSDGSQAQR